MYVRVCCLVPADDMDLQEPVSHRHCTPQGVESQQSESKICQKDEILCPNVHLKGRHKNFDNKEGGNYPAIQEEQNLILPFLGKPLQVKRTCCYTAEYTHEK